jgi:RHS repeat-associated protein
MQWPVAAHVTFMLALVFATSCATSGPSQEYSHAGDLITEWPEEAELTLRDHLGSGVAVVDVNGADRFQRSYHPYGSTRSEFVADLGAATGQADHYVGNERDVGADLGHFHARPYDYQVGRFLGPDPLRLFPSWGDDASTAHLAAYSYTAGNPIRLLDPSGQKPHDHFFSPDVAALDMALNTTSKTYESDRGLVEYGALIYRMEVDGQEVFSYTVPVPGMNDNKDLVAGHVNPTGTLPDAATLYADIHIHPSKATGIYKPGFAGVSSADKHSRGYSPENYVVLDNRQLVTVSRDPRRWKTNGVTRNVAQKIPTSGSRDISAGEAMRVGLGQNPVAREESFKDFFTATAHSPSSP